jgi:hypothetical protein
MAKHKQPDVVTYSEEERRRYLFRTAAEMRFINDRADERTAKYSGHENAGTDVDEPASIR